VWQNLGYISSRKYPAQIVFTRSGRRYENDCDFLEARIFHEKHPTGEEIEVYILTSELGAERIKSRAGLYNLQSRIHNMLIVIPPSLHVKNTTLSDDMNLSLVSRILYQKYGMKLVDHDGGQQVLNEFCQARLVSQINLTLCRHQTVKQVVESLPEIDTIVRSRVLNDFDAHMQYMFSSPSLQQSSSTILTEKTVISHRGIPKSMKLIHALTDTIDENIVVATFDTRHGINFTEFSL